MGLKHVLSIICFFVVVYWCFPIPLTSAVLTTCNIVPLGTSAYLSPCPSNILPVSNIGNCQSFLMTCNSVTYLSNKRAIEFCRKTRSSSKKMKEIIAPTLLFTMRWVLYGDVMLRDSLSNFYELLWASLLFKCKISSLPMVLGIAFLQLAFSNFIHIPPSLAFSKTVKRFQI